MFSAQIDGRVVDLLQRVSFSQCSSELNQDAALLGIDDLDGDGKNGSDLF